MQVKPLSKDIFDKAVNAGIDAIILHFSGGSDEGYLTVELQPYEKDSDADFNSEIEEWAWSVYDYSGAGGGSDYGDDITYNLKDKTVTTSEWYMERTEGDSETSNFDVE